MKRIAASDGSGVSPRALLYRVFEQVGPEQNPEMLHPIRTGPAPHSDGACTPFRVCRGQRAVASELDAAMFARSFRWFRAWTRFGHQIRLLRWSVGYRPCGRELRGGAPLRRRHPTALPRRLTLRDRRLRPQGQGRQATKRSTKRVGCRVYSACVPRAFGVSAVGRQRFRLRTFQHLIVLQMC